MFFREPSAHNQLSFLNPGEVWATKLLEEPERTRRTHSDYTPNSLEVSLSASSDSSGSSLRIAMQNSESGLDVDLGVFASVNGSPDPLQSGIQLNQSYHLDQGTGIAAFLPQTTSSGLIARMAMLSETDPHSQALNNSNIPLESKRGLFRSMHRHMILLGEPFDADPEFEASREFFDGAIKLAVETCTELFLERWMLEGRDLEWTSMPRKHLDAFILASVGPYLMHSLQEIVFGTPEQVLNSKMLYNEHIRGVDPTQLTTVFERLSREYIHSLAAVASESYRYFVYTKSLLSKAGRNRSLGIKELEYLKRANRVTSDFDPETLENDDPHDFRFQAYTIPHNFDPGILLAVSDRLLLHEFRTGDLDMSSSEVIEKVVRKTLGMMGFVGDIQNSLLSSHGPRRVAFPHHVLEREYHEDMIEYLTALRGKR